MKSKDEIERTRAFLKLMRLTMPPILFVVLTLVLTSVFGVPFWLAALIGLLLAAAEYITFSLLLNRWAGL
jgi:hypothetical protein